MHRNRPDDERRRGLTLLECLVAIGIMGFLFAILAPAVQQSREAARRTHCGNNLRQLGMALNSYASGWDCLPPAVISGKSPITGFGHGYSPQSVLLPYLEHVDAYNSINFSLRGVSLDLSDLKAGIDPGNLTARNTKISVFLCPSDPEASKATGPLNYRACLGVCGGCEVFDTGAFAIAITGRFSNIRDGASNTLAFAEKPISGGNGRGPNAFTDWIDLFNVYPRPKTMAGWISRCSSIPMDRALFQGDAGATWLLGQASYVHFYTITTPHSLTPDCSDRGVPSSGIYTSRSYHGDGVNTVLVDGSVHRVQSSVNLEVWRGLGTRSGGEVLNLQ